MSLKKSQVAMAVALAVAGLLACSPKGSAEKTGEKMDSAIEESTQGTIDRGDGALEKAGEAIDKANGRKNDDPADALNDATDGNAKTKP
jgi:hypothetical protein